MLVRRERPRWEGVWGANTRRGRRTLRRVLGRVALWWRALKPLRHLGGIKVSGITLTPRIPHIPDIPYISRILKMWRELPLERWIVATPSSL